MRYALMITIAAGCATAPSPSMDPLVRFARAQDGEGLAQVEASLEDPAPVRRRQAAFALGQLGVAWDPVDETLRTRAVEDLLRLLPRERDPEARDRIVEALGKLGSPKVAELLDGPERARAAVALGVMAKSGRLKQPVAVPKLQALLADPDDEVRWAAAYALERMKAGDLSVCLHDRVWRVRAACARAAGDASLLEDPDERVAAEAARTLARAAVKCAADQPCAPLAALANVKRPQVLAAIAAEPITHPDAARLFADGTDCARALVHDRAAGKLERIPTCDGDARRRGVYAARALGEGAGDENERRHALVARFDDPDPAVRAAVAEALGELASHAVDEPLAQHLGDERDPAVLAAIAEAVAKHHVSGIELTLRNRLLALAAPDAPVADSIDALEALIAAAGALKVHEVVPNLLQLAQHRIAAVRTAAADALVDMGLPRPARVTPAIPAAAPIPDARVRIETSRGVIVLHLFGADAPRTVENFLKLVDRKFYDGLSFHRVVPDFVVQGGDPRGDGSGGPGWLISCEINPRRYGEGTVGMALSGRDTGGSQFFITLSPQPHLDGRYTAFGQVEEGMDVVRSLVEGDRIVSVRVSR